MHRYLSRRLCKVAKISVEKIPIPRATTTSSDAALPSDIPSQPSVIDPAGNPAFLPDPDAIISSKDQILYPATRAEIEVLANSPVLYRDPQASPGSIIVRVVRLSDAVSSPVTRVVRNRQYGIRGDEWVNVLGLGLALSCVFVSLGFWQLRRMVYKRDLIEKRRDRISQPPVLIDPEIPWDEDSYLDFEYRQAQVHGILDPSRELLVGPRSFSFNTSEMGGAKDPMDSVGYLVITPLILADGHQILVNRGAISLRNLKTRRKEFPIPATIRGVLNAGELSGTLEWWRLPNRPVDRKFLFLNVKDLADAAQITRNFNVARLLLLTATEEQSGGFKYAKKKKEDFLCFYGDEHTHLWYAVQWFACAGLLSAMSCWRAFALGRLWKW